MKPKLWCDIDSTINDHGMRIRRNTLPQWPGERIDPKAFTREEVRQDKLLYTIEQIVGGGMFSKSIHSFEDDFEITFLTARGWKDARIITMDWLKVHKIKYKSLLIVPTMEAKIKLLEFNRPDFYIDDFMSGQEKAIPTFRADIAQAIQGLGINVIVFRNDWNEVIDMMRYYMETKP